MIFDQISRFLLFNRKFEPNEEEEFFSYYRISHISILRIGYILAIVLYAFFGFLDLYMMPISKYQILMIRFFFVIPSIIGFYYLTQTKYYLKYSSLFAAISAIVAGFGILAMLIVSQDSEPGFHIYVNGLFLVIPWIYGFLRLKLRYANTICLGLIFSYIFISIYKQNEDDYNPYMIANVVFLISEMIIGFVFYFYWEFLIRQEFLQNKKIRFVNSHKLRAPIARLIGLLDSYALSLNKKTNDLSSNWMHLLIESGKDIDKSINELQLILSDRIQGNVDNKTLSNKMISKVFEKVYLVDDDKVCNILAEKIIRKSFPDLPLFSYTNPLIALKELEKEQSDLVLIFLDINMPEMNGFEFLERLKSNQLNPFVVMLTSSIDESDKIKAFSYINVISYISKPINKENAEHVIKGMVIGD